MYHEIWPSMEKIQQFQLILDEFHLLLKTSDWKLEIEDGIYWVRIVQMAAEFKNNFSRTPT